MFQLLNSHFQATVFYKNVNHIILHESVSWDLNSDLTIMDT